MNDKRGTLQVRQDSFPWRVYKEWRLNKGHSKTERAQIDLCHFVRVFLIFGPWRWFWQSPFVLDLQPFLIVLLLSALGGLAFAFYVATSTMLYILSIFGIVVGVLLAIVGLVAILVSIYSADEEKWNKRAEVLAEKILSGLAWVFAPIGNAIGFVFDWITDHIVLPAGNWFFRKMLFSLEIDDELVVFTPFGLVFLAWICTGISLGFYLFPFWFAIGIGSLVGLIALIIGLVVGIKMAWRCWHDFRPISLTKPPKTKKEHPTRDVVWSFMVAKKHRICPLIQPIAD